MAPPPPPDHGPRRPVVFEGQYALALAVAVVLVGSLALVVYVTLAA